MSTGSRDWDAGSYDRISDPQLEWGRKVVARLALEGDETVLDAGCGSGRVTELLVDALPRGRVIAVDASPQMIDAAAQRLGGSAELRVADLLDLELAAPVDAVFSNAVFHWIADHERLFSRLAAALRPGGRIEAQCGGAGNVAGFKAAAEVSIAKPRFAEYFDGWVRPWNFATPADTENRLAQAGFTDPSCSLCPAPATPPSPREYVRTVCAGPYLERLPADLHEEFLDALAAQLDDPLVLDYVRLDISARRA